MSSYQFHFLNNRRALSCLVHMDCISDEEAKKQAQALTGIAHAALEIWRGETKVFEANRFAPAH